MAGGLKNKKHEMFAREYLEDLNATQAAIRAGYSKKTAGQQGFDLLKKPEIEHRVRELMDERAERTEITADRVLNELARIGFSDIRNAVRWGSKPTAVGGDGTDMVYPVELVPSEEIDGDTAAAISEVSLTQQGVKIKLVDKKGALDSMARHLGMFIDRVDNTSSDGTMTPKEPDKVDAALLQSLVDKLTG